MFRSKTGDVQPGDRFVKATEANTNAWEVVETWVAVDGIRHARLRNQKQGRLATIAAGVLSDPSFWKPAQAG